MSSYSLHLQSALRNGSHVVIEAGRFSSVDLWGLASSARSGGGHLTIRGCSRLSPIDLFSVSQAGATYVTLVCD